MTRHRRFDSFELSEASTEVAPGGSPCQSDSSGSAIDTTPISSVTRVRTPRGQTAGLDRRPPPRRTRDTPPRQPGGRATAATGSFEWLTSRVGSRHTPGVNDHRGEGVGVFRASPPRRRDQVVSHRSTGPARGANPRTSEDGLPAPRPSPRTSQEHQRGSSSSLGRRGAPRHATPTHPRERGNRRRRSERTQVRGGNRHPPDRPTGSGQNVRRGPNSVTATVGSHVDTAPRPPDEVIRHEVQVLGGGQRDASDVLGLLRQTEDIFPSPTHVTRPWASATTLLDAEELSDMEE